MASLERTIDVIAFCIYDKREDKRRVAEILYEPELKTQHEREAA